MNEKTTQESIEIAYHHLQSEEDEGDAYWELITQLHGLVSREDFDLFMALCHHEDPLYRKLGADLLSQFGYKEDKPFRYKSGRSASKI